MSSTGPLQELESLRSHMADLAHELAERDQTMEVIREQSRHFHAIIEGTGSKAGHEFFTSLVTHLTTTLRLQYALLANITGTESTTLRTMAVSVGGHLVDNFDYELPHTPCERVLEGRPACFQREVRQQFPRAAQLTEFGVEGYCGVPLCTTTGLVVGLLIVMDTKPLGNTEWLRSLMTTLASRAAAELERQQAETAVRESQERFNLAMQGSQTGIWDWDLRTQQAYFSPIWKQQLGYDESELPGRIDAWRSRLHPDEYDCALATLQACLDGHRSHYELEHRLRHKNGSYRWILARGRSIRDEHGTPYRMAGTHLDITERKLREDARRESEDRFRSFFDHTPHPAFLKATDGKYLYVNHRFETDFGIPRTDVVGKTDHDLFPLHQAEHFASHDRQVLEQQQAKDFEELAEYTDGLHTSIVAKFPLRNAAGHIASIGGIATDITERAQAERVLRLAQFTIDHAVDAIYWIDPQAKIMRVNEAACRMLGYSEEELCAMTVHDLNPAFPADKWPGFWAETQQRKTLTIETSHQHKQGRLIPVEIQINYLSHEGQEFHCVSARNITDRKRAEEEMRTSEERFRRMFEHAPLGMCILGEDKRLLRVNRRFCNIVGYSESELLGQTHTFYTHPADLAENLWMTEEFFRRERSGYSLEKRYRCKGGEEKWVRVTTTTIERHADQAPVLLAMVEDITERKQAEDSLRKNERRFRTLAQVSPVGIFRTDAAGQCLYVNDRWCAIANMTPDAAIGNGWTAALHPDDRERIATEWAHAEKNHLPFKSEYRFQQATGPTTWVVGQAQAEIDQHGNVIGHVGTVTDITDRKHMEETLHRREQDLRKAIDERERISQDLHDGILQSLYAVGLGLESCKPLMRQRKARKASELLEQGIGQMNRVMGEIRNFIAGLDSGMLSGDTFSDAIHALIETVTATQPLQCTVTIDAAAGRLSTDQALHFMNVVREALSNSLRHGHATKATVSLKQLAHSIRLSVSDNGRGFNPDSVRGVGHGLTNMAARAHKMGGRFAVRSAHERGTRIIVDVPQKEA